MGVTVVHPRRLGSAPARCDGWVYADDDLGVLEAVTVRFGTASRLVPPADFQAAAAARRRSFVEWVDANLAGRSLPEWLTTPLQKSPFVSHLFLHAVWADLVAEALSASRAEVLVVSEWSELAAVLERLAAERGVACRVVGKTWFGLARWRRRLRALAVFGKSLLDVLLRTALARLLLGEAQRRRLAGCEILVETFVHQGDLSPDGGLRDRYFPGLVEWYLARGRAAAVYPQLYGIRWRNLPQTYRRMRASSVPFAPFELFVRAGDISAAAAGCIGRALQPPRLAVSRFRAVNMQPAMAEFSFRNALSAMPAMLLATVPARLASAGVSPRSFVDWYENQPLDQATVWGFLRSGGCCEVIAGRLYVPYDNAINLFSSAEEMRCGVAPRKSWVCSQLLADIFERYRPGGEYRVMPALRYGHLHAPVPEGTGNRNGTLLVILTHSLSESINILSLVLGAIDAVRAGVGEIVIKPHRDVGIVRMRQVATARLPRLAEVAGIRWTMEPLEMLFGGARLAVSAGSSAAMEAVCRGVPVVIAGRAAGLNQIPLTGVDPRIWRIAYDEVEFAAAFRELVDVSQLNGDLRGRIGEATREAYFPRVAEGMDSFLPETPARQATVAATP